MDHKILKCVKCRELFGCSSKEIQYICVNCAYYNPCVQYNLSQHLDIEGNGLCPNCVNEKHEVYQ